MTVAVLCVLVLSGRPASAFAHAVLLRSDPAQNSRLNPAPGRVDLFFSEPLNHSYSIIQVRNSAGTRVDSKNLRFSADPTEMTIGLPAIDPGFYTVEWTTVSSVDGHRLDGTYPFTVLNQDGSTPAGAAPVISSGTTGSAGVQPFDAVLRWLLLTGLIGIAGGFGFAAIVLFPAAGALAEPDRDRARAFALWLLGAVVPAAMLVVVSINLAALVRQAALNGSLGSIGDLLHGKAGLYWGGRELLGLACGGLSLWLARRERRPEGAIVPAMLWLGLALSLLALLTMSLTSHAAAGGGAYWSVPSDFLHLAGVSLWLGSLVQLPALLRIRRSLDGAGRSRFLGAGLRRFSTLAVCCVWLVLLSGAFNALVQIPSWAALKDTAYGKALIVKLLLLAPLLGVGAWNAVRTARRFERLSLAMQPDAAAVGDRLARNAVIESVAGALVIAATAVMVFLVPAKDAQAQAQAQRTSSQAAPVSSVFRNQAPAGDLAASLTVTPNRVGENGFRVLLAGPDVDQVQRVQLRFQAQNQPVGGSAVTADPVEGTAGLFDAKAANFSFVGDWRVTINIRRIGHDDVNGNFTVQVPDATGATTSAVTLTSRSPSAFPAHGISREQAWGALLIAVGALVFVFRRQLWTLSPALGTVGVLGISGALIVGIAVVIAGRRSVSGVSNVTNPVPPDERSVAAGKTLFMANCAVCHGNTGHGDGPNAAALNPRPLDLTVHVGLHPDGQIFDWITNGIPRTSMPAWKATLTPNQRWDVLNYLRTFSSGATDVAPAPARQQAKLP